MIMDLKRTMVIALGFAASVSLPANAGTFIFDFDGSGVSGSVTLTYAPNPKAGGPLGSSPNIFDPIGSFVVTGATGSFTDTNLGISTIITGVVASNPDDPEPDNLLAPASFGHYIVAHGVPGPGGVAPGFSYDDLFYPAGSPQTASDYPFHGGFFDIYGLVFTTSGGVAVNFWSNGDFGGGPIYGAGVTDGTDVLDYVGGIDVRAVPESETWAMMVAGLGLVGMWMRVRRRVAVRYARGAG